LGLPVLQQASLPLDALIGSGLDPSEQVPEECLNPAPTVRIATEGDAGGVLIPGGRFEAVQLPGPMIESYGCGDSFAAGVTAGLSAGWSIHQAVGLGARCGAACATRFGPYG
jgi:ribokinase